MGKRRESFETVQRSVVRVKDASGQTWGTGFFISREGHLLTCAHVVEDAGGWKNVRILDQPVSCLYEGDPERDDFCLLQVEDLQVTPVELGKDFDPGDEFLSFGFSNDDFYGAPLRGEITAFARCGKLGDQKLIRLETFSDAQRIEGGQSGAPVLTYKKGCYQAVGLIVASEDSNGGLAISTLTIQKNSTLTQATGKRFNLSFSKLFIAVGAVSILIATSVSIFVVNKANDKCSSSAIASVVSRVGTEIDARKDATAALAEANAGLQECPNSDKLMTSKSRALVELKRYDEAVSVLQDALKLRESAEARFNLGVALSISENYSTALPEFEKASQNERLRIRALYNVGRCLYKLERFPEALEKLKYVFNNTQDTDHFSTDSLFYLVEINAKLWYRNRNKDAEKFKSSYLKYYKVWFERLEAKEKEEEAVKINRVLSTLLSSQEGQDIERAFIYHHKDFKKTLCDIYQSFQPFYQQSLKSIQSSCYGNERT